MDRIEVWLSYNNREEVLQLPVPPPDFKISKGNENTVVNIESIGEINIPGKGKLATISLSSFFPAQNYAFCQYIGFPIPYKCIELIEKWRNTSRPIRLVITQSNINMAVTIESFEYGERDGTRDVYFDLSLKEYRFITTDTNSSSTTTAIVTRETKDTPTKYIVKPGDTLWAIAKRTTGKGENYSLIASANGIKDVNQIAAGQELIINATA